MVQDDYFAFRVLAKASAKVGGNFEVESSISKRTKIIYAPLDMNLNYADHVLRSTIHRHLGVEAYLAWMRENDMKTRGHMINLMKNGTPQGEALTLALAKTEVSWPTGHQGTSGSKRSRSGGDQLQEHSWQES